MRPQRIGGPFRRGAVMVTEAQTARALAYVATAPAGMLPAYRDAVRAYPDSFAAFNAAVLPAITRRAAEVARAG